MVRLTQDSVGKAYIDGFDCKIEIVGVRDGFYVGYDCIDCCYNEYVQDGAIFGGQLKGNLLKEYVKPRTKNEVGNRMAEVLEQFADELDRNKIIWCETQSKNVRDLVEEAVNVFGNDDA